MVKAAGLNWNRETAQGIKAMQRERTVIEREVTELDLARVVVMERREH